MSEGVDSLPAMLMGLLLAGCASSVVAQPDYGTADLTDTGYTDDDGDGYAEVDGDCDDEDRDINPGAEEAAGDGIDSNCDGEDDT